LGLAAEVVRDDTEPLKCADFAHGIGEIAESAKLCGRFSPSAQELRMHTLLLRRMIAKTLCARAGPQPHHVWLVSVQGGSSSGIAIAQ